MTKSIKRNVIVSALLSICLCVSLIAGATFAIFTSESKVNIAVTSGKVKVTATVSELEAYSPAAIAADGSITDKDNTADNTAEKKIFGNGGAAELSYAEDGTAKITLTNATPGDKVTFKITVTNYSNVSVKYRTRVAKAKDSDETLYNALKFEVGGMTIDGKSSWANLAPVTGEDGTVVDTYKCSVELPAAVSGAEYMEKSCAIEFTVEAVQGNADTTEYAEGITTKGFEEAENVEYTNNLGNVVTGNKPAVAAYIDSEGNVKYVGDIYSAVKSGASVIFCKKDVTLRMREREVDTNRSPDLTDNLTIYANGADFQHGQISMNMTAAGKAANITVRIYDAKNIEVWGSTPDDGVTQTIVMENCRNEGESAVKDKGIMLYITGNTGTVNATIKNCYISKNSSGIYMSTNGSLTVLDSVFVECAAGIKSSYKGNGTRTDRIENCTFTGCGCTEEMANGTTWLSEDSAAIKCKISSGAEGAFALTLKNNVISGTIGDKGDMQIASGVVVTEE